jgi:hypothetical protein
MKPSQSQVDILYQSLRSRYDDATLKTLGNEAKVFADYLYALSDFKVIDAPVSSAGNHVGAVIIDGVLQVAHDFEEQVRPAVGSIRKFPEAATVSGFINLLNTKPLDSLINFGGQTTRNNLLNVAIFFRAKGVDSFDDLHVWLGPENNRDSLLTAESRLGEGVFRIGDKTADYFRVLVGHWDAVAVDRGVRQLLDNANIISRHSKRYDYKQVRAIVQLTAIAYLGCRPLDLDASIYNYYVSNKRSRQRPPEKRKSVVLASEHSKYCIYCGVSIPQIARYCSKCGGLQP